VKRCGRGGGASGVLPSEYNEKNQSRIRYTCRALGFANQSTT